MANTKRVKCPWKGCSKYVAKIKISSSGVVYYKKHCSTHSHHARAKKLGVSISDLHDRYHPYRRYKKTYCENKDRRLGWKCTTTIRSKSSLALDHIDGNPTNNDSENLQTLCHCCHVEKSIMRKDHLSPGRSKLKCK